MAIKTGDDAEATEMGAVVGELMDAFEAMDLSPHLKGMKIVILADTETEGVAAASNAYDNPKEAAATLMQHAAVLLGQMGIGVEVMTGEDLEQLMNPQANA